MVDENGNGNGTGSEKPQRHEDPWKKENTSAENQQFLEGLQELGFENHEAGIVLSVMLQTNNKKILKSIQDMQQQRAEMIQNQIFLQRYPRGTGRAKIPVDADRSRFKATASSSFSASTR